jgi:hypothetical protein
MANVLDKEKEVVLSANDDIRRTVPLMPAVEKLPITTELSQIRLHWSHLMHLPTAWLWLLFKSSLVIDKNARYVIHCHERSRRR